MSMGDMLDAGDLHTLQKKVQKNGYYAIVCIAKE
jgi:hypothetical protein